jgi:hypothetical protein
MKRRMICCVVLLVASVPALAETAAAESAAAAKSSSVRTFQFKHKTAEEAAAAIKGLRSAEGTVSITNNALVVSDTAENLRQIAAALAKFDVAPQPFRLSIRLVSAGRAEEARIPPELKELAPKLALLRYNSLDHIGFSDVVAAEGQPGLIDLDGYRAEFKLGEYDAASDSLKVSDLKLSRHEGEALQQLLKTSLNLKLGQTVILGATRQPNAGRALMIVISAKR